VVIDMRLSLFEKEGAVWLHQLVGSYNFSTRIVLFPHRYSLLVRFGVIIYSVWLQFSVVLIPVLP